MTAPLLRATAVLAAGRYDEARVIDSVILDWEGRNKRRAALEGVKGTGFVVDLPDVVSLRMDDALVLDDGRLIQVVAEAEPLMEVKAKEPGALTRLAWHIGNRHLAVEIRANRLRLRADHVIADMLKGLGAEVRAIEAPFDPEGGAYLAAPVAAHGHHHHDHHHDHGHHDHGHHDHGHHHDHHDHAHHHDHGQAKTAEAHDHAAADHVHGPGCGHDHHDHHHHDHHHGPAGHKHG